MNDSIILASGNKKKIEELSFILKDFGKNIIPQSQLEISDAVEDGLTFVENALKKARHACFHGKLPAIADDSGLEVDALKGAPGIYSSRFSGANATDQTNNKKLIQALTPFGQECFSARYQCVIVYLEHVEDPTPVICQGTWEGDIILQPQGDDGFGYDPLFYLSKMQCTAAQLTTSEKKELSHRGKALEQLKAHFDSVMS